MSDTDLELLQRYTRDHAEDAFAEIVRRHLGLVYSAALRQVRSPQLAEEAAQSAFTDLARHAHRLAPDTILSAWLYQVTRRTAIDVIRREARRQAREQIATEMNAMNAETADWTHIEPLLDEAMHALDETDRAAVLLRYFENKSLREVGDNLGLSEDAAQKRVSRAVERLREFLSRRGVTVGAGGLVAVVSAHAVQAAPVGLAVTISTAAVLTGTTLTATSTVIAATQTIAMTTLQKTIITITLAAAVGAGIYEARQVSLLRRENQALQQQPAPPAGQLEELQRERDAATNRVAALVEELAAAKRNPSEVLKLRSEVGTLRQEKNLAGKQSALNKITADPETRKLLRDQQKLGMSNLYKELAGDLKMSPEQKGKLDDLLADQVMDNIDLITQSLQDQKSPEEIDRLFSAQDAASREQMLALMGPEVMAQYEDYTKNLGSKLTAMQFESNLTGDKAAKADKRKQLLLAMQQETQAALAAAGLPADYQTVPMLNFRNIASEAKTGQSLKLLDDIYDRVAARGNSFLTPAELEKFKEFKAQARKNSEMMLIMNRKMMAPLAK